MSPRPLPKPLFIAVICGALASCGQFPELAVSEAQFDRSTPYPKLIPLEVLLKEPEPAITDEFQTSLTEQRDDLLAAPGDAGSSASVLDRIDALRARKEAQSRNDPSIDDALRERMERGIKPPSETE